jgi:hypothetical protein
MPDEASIDRAGARIEREFLTRLADSAGDDAIREMAGQILAGAMRWSEAARSHAYGEALAQMISPVVEDPELLSPEAIAEWQAEAEASFETFAEEESHDDAAANLRHRPW